MKKITIVILMFCLAGIGVGQAAVSPKDYNETAGQLLKSAVMNDDLDQVKQAFVMGADPNFLQGLHDAPFTRAIRKSKSTGIVQCFIANGVDVNFETVGNGNFPSALAAAIHERRLDIIKMLLNAGADPNLGFDAEISEGSFLIDVHEVTVVFRVVQSDELIDLNILKLLTEKGANINKADSLGNTPLMTACEQGKLESVKILLTNGATPNQADHKSKNLWILQKNQGIRN